MVKVYGASDDLVGDEKEFVGYIKKYKMVDKLKALELLGKHLGIWERQDKQQTAVEDLTPPGGEIERVRRWNGLT